MEEPTEKVFENLVFEGGGVRGFAYCGVINELNNMKLLSQFKRFSGTSIGALFATLLAAGFSSREIIDIKDNLTLSNLAPGCCISTTFKILNNFGVNSLSKLETQFREILKQKLDPDITLIDLYKLSGKELVIVTCCLDMKKAVYLHHAQFPNVKLIDAIISSMSVPFIFKPNQYKFLGTTDYYVDGGIVDNYPIWVFNDLDALYQGNMDNVDREKIPPVTLGLKLLCQDESNTVQVYNGRTKIKNIFNVGLQLINTLMLQIERSGISPSYITQTVPIFTGNVSFMDFNVSKETIKMLVKLGSDSVNNYFQKHNVH